MTRDYYELPKSSSVMRFLWKCAGGDRYLLERATYSDQIKYMCLGGIVFATGAMAGLAGGYAFYTIFSPKSANVLDKVVTVIDNPDLIPTDIPSVIMALIFGVIWGLIIFNIDRFIVTSTGKGDGTEKITKDEIIGAIPRIIMGMIIAITISKPIEIRMFQSEINIAVKAEQDSLKGVRIDQIQTNYEKSVSELKKNLGRIQTGIDDNEKLISEYENTLRIEISGDRPGYGDRAKNLERLKSIAENKLIELKNNSLYKSVSIDLRAAEVEKQKKIKNIDKELASLDGLLIRIRKAHQEAGWTITIFITLLFMAIELTPIFFKLMLTKTTYDYLAENRDELIKADYGIEVKYDYYKDKQGIEKHLTINHEAEKLIYEKIKVTEIQKELTDYAIQKYKEREKKKIDENLDTYIKSIDKNEQDV
ncbi:DUF4407 domain-containing protein [Flavobacterium nackdongense]|uniref:DUF4407 domain-containing protein n=1 Tax=Flavobacterium nackdongense TaxID=2547394 RepID=A0A4P6YBU2_9FLAO|nr:DUF4407 domain-containing protein [Flavobacterium nackdongense]QBN17800.1 DUF4407 domain-containing protein [Flavobacterium nackdongense]